MKPKQRRYPTADTIQPMFGSVLRGLRLGYYYAHSKGGFIRIIPGPPHRIDIAPVGGIPSGRNGKGELHACWWDEPNAEEKIIAQIKPLQGVTKIKRAASFYVDDNGERL